MDINMKAPREIIKKMIIKEEKQKLLEISGLLHGHYCPGLAYGVLAAYEGMRRLEADTNTGMEEIMAVVECNNCFVDGIQFVSGCTLGNNALVYADAGKTAVTFYKRNEDYAVRLRVSDHRPPAKNDEGAALFEKAVKRREKLSDEERNRFGELWRKKSLETVLAPAGEILEINKVPVKNVKYAPIMDSLTCDECGEVFMESKAAEKEGKKVCLACSGNGLNAVTGEGIRKIEL
ncbi:MAG: FmdE family protein [Fibrobacterota bacterium]